MISPDHAARYATVSLVVVDMVGLSQASHGYVGGGGVVTPGPPRPRQPTPVVWAI